MSCVEGLAMNGKFLSLMLMVVGGLGLPAPILAHGATIEYRQTKAIQIQALYDTGEPLAEAQVAVYAPNDPASAWMTGTTDEQGWFLFRPDPEQPGNWEVTVRQSGHGDIVVIPVEAGDLNPDAATDGIATSRPTQTPLQKGLMVASVLWGCVGTALFFSQSRS